MSEKVLIVLHQEQSTPGRVGYALRQRGYELDIRRPRFGDALPQTMAEHAGAVIFGGPQSANDPDDFIKTEIEWIGVPLKEGKPYLGICLGAQMLAKQLGERVFTHPEGKAEVGYYPVRPTPAGDRKSTRLNSSHLVISYAVFCLKKKNFQTSNPPPAPNYDRPTLTALAAWPSAPVCCLHRYLESSQPYTSTRSPSYIRRQLHTVT